MIFGSKVCGVVFHLHTFQECDTEGLVNCQICLCVQLVILGVTIRHSSWSQIREQVSVSNTAQAIAHGSPMYCLQ